MVQILCRDPALGKLGTKLLDYTPLFNFPAPKLLRNPALCPTPRGMAEVNSSPAGRERGSVSPQGCFSFPPPKKVTPSLLNQAGNTRSPQGRHPSSLYMLEDIGVFPHCPISPPASPKGRPTRPQRDEKCISAITYFILSFCNKCRLINHVLFFLTLSL